MSLRSSGERRGPSLFPGSLFSRSRHWFASCLALALLASLLQAITVLSSPAASADEPAPASRGAVTEDEAAKLAAKSGKPVEVLAKRGEQRTVMALPDGGFEVVEHLRPVRVRERGGWVDVDPGLSKSDGAVVPKASTVNLRFSGGGNEPLAVMARDGHTMEFSWPTKLPEPVITEDVATYRGALGEDVDLQVRALADGFTHTLVVKSPEAAADPRLAELAFGLKATGLKVSQDKAGLLTAADASSGASIFEAPRPVMWDSSSKSAAKKARSAASGAADPAADPAEGPLDGAKTARLDVELGAGKLTLRPDRRMLTADDTKFPVFIDPVWTATKASRWAMVSSAFPNESYYKFDGKATEGVGRCLVSVDSNCVVNQTKRLFYRMPLPAIRGAHVSSAEFVAYETHAYDCHNPTTVQLYRTSALSTSPTWNSTSGAWGEHLKSRDVAYCSRAPVEFGGDKVRSHVQSAVNSGYSTITFGLRAYSESSMGWWKRFADDAYLRIRYNRPPNQPDTDTMFANPGTKCRPAGQAGTVNAIPTVYAYLSDPDREDANKVRGQFTLHWDDGSGWGEQWTGDLTPALSSGSRHDMKLPSTIPVGTLIAWGVRAYDGSLYGPWSYSGAQQGCYFYYDPAVPAKPQVSSEDYPFDGSWNGGVGETGKFTVSDTEGVADRYVVTLNDQPARTITTTDGAARTIEVAPDKSGPNILTVQAFAPSGQNGPSITHEFNVNAGADPVAHYKLDENAGSSKVASSGPGRSAWLRGGASLGGESESSNPDDKALVLDGEKQFAESPVPVVDTTESFTVSAWAKPTEHRQGEILAQSGTHQSGFVLGMHADGRAIFEWPTVDNDQGGTPWQFAVDDTPLSTTEWSHLVGVYDKGAGQMRLYVNGELQATTDGVTAPLKTHGPLQIGRSLYNGFQVNYWPGSIDDVQAFARPLSDAQAQQLAAGTTPSDAGQVAHWDMDEPADESRVYSPEAWSATVHGGGTLGADGRAGTALSLDNTAQQYAATTQPVVNTLRSFAVSAWLKVDGSATSPSQNFTAVSVRGQSKSGFYLKYVEANDTWVFARTAHDSDETGWYQATFQGAQTDEWAHVVGVYDSITQRLKIYVNGEKGQDSAVVDSRWLATGGLEIGRSQWVGTPVDYWAGQIDDVRVYDRIVGAQEVEKMITQHPVLKARWSMNAQPVGSKVSGEPAWAPQLTLHEGATITQDASFLGLPFPVPGYAGMQLSSGGFAETTGQVVRTDESYTVAGWVKTPDVRPQEAQTVFSQAGDNANAMVLRYAPDPTTEGVVWQAEMRNADAADPDNPDATPRVASYVASFYPREWTHVAVVYDALRNELNLYVGGSLQNTGEKLSQAGEVIGFDKSGSVLQLGRDGFAGTGGGAFWNGPVDDVWAYQGALTAEQVGSLAVQSELNTPGIVDSKISFRATAGYNANTQNAAVTVPEQVQAGDGMLLFLTTNNATATITPPQGWTQLDEIVNVDARSIVWHRTAAAEDVGSEVSVAISEWVKADLQLAAYAGTGSPPVVTSVKASDAGQPQHQAPAVTVNEAGNWVVWYWGEKSSSTTAWTPPTGTIPRASAVGSGNGRVSSLLADSGQGVAAGTHGPLTASTDMESGRGNMWAVVLRST